MGSEGTVSSFISRTMAKVGSSAMPYSTIRATRRDGLKRTSCAEQSKLILKETESNEKRSEVLCKYRGSEGTFYAIRCE